MFLPLFTLLPDPQEYPLTTALFYSLVDIVNAKALVSISNSGVSIAGSLYLSSRKDVRWDGTTIAAWYLFNPFTVATCLGRSTTVFTTTAILAAVSNAVIGNSLNSMIALGFASYFSLYPALFFIPLVILCYDQHARNGTKQTPNTVSFAIQHLLVWLASIVGLLGVSYLIVGDFWEFITATYGFQLLVPDLTPNVGLWWYFFIEMFDSFREFFLGVFWLHLAGYVGGLTVRLRRQPLFVITSLLGIFAIFKPYPSVSDVSLYLALLPLYRHLFPCTLNPIAKREHVLILGSDALYLLCGLCHFIRDPSWPSVLSVMDLCWVWKC